VGLMLLSARVPTARPIISPTGSSDDPAPLTNLGCAVRLAALAIAVLCAQPVFAATPTAVATFTCKGGKTIGASFYADKVELKLSDGRSLSLPQAMSGSGARYANKDESFVFWNKGNTAFITEGAAGEETYSDCVTK
jgi:membrane-bound inhibitor of C-type lysozyme